MHTLTNDEWTNILCFLPVAELATCCTINHQFNDHLLYPNSYVWKERLVQILNMNNNDCLEEIEQLKHDHATFKDAVQYEFTFKFNDEQVQALVRKDSLQFSHRGKQMKATASALWASARMNQAIRENEITCWEVVLDAVIRSDNVYHAVIGLASDSFPFTEQNIYSSLIGNPSNGIGFNIGQKTIYGYTDLQTGSHACKDITDGDIMTFRVNTRRPAQSLANASVEIFVNYVLAFEFNAVDLKEHIHYPAVSLFTSRQVTIRKCSNHFLESKIKSPDAT